MPYLSDADMSDLEFGAKMKYDFIAASFVRNAADINYLRRYTQSLGWFDVRIIAKIENLEGVENIDEILEAADGIMVARGDMGVEIPFEQIPAIQKDLIHKGYNAGKQVITATQMLESMISNPRPTRAEITDVANAIYDGTSAIMLSGETAAGDYPVEAVSTMALIAETTEKNIDYKSRFYKRGTDSDTNVANAISHASVTTAHDLDVKAIITVTKGGGTARLISKYRPLCPIISCTTSETVCRQMNMSWGVTPLVINEETNTDELFEHAVAAAKEKGLVNVGDTVVITAGVPLGISGTTNLMKVDTVK
jgi:pyruvate kinase